MKLTPLDIRHREFRRGMRGYADEEVDLFLDEVADEFERLFRENIEAQETIERLQEKVSEFDQLKETLQHTLVTAQQQADDVRANARKEAELMLRDAELKGRDILADSYSEKQRVQQNLIQLRQIEEDFRFKFRSLLEAHLNLLTEDESSEDRRWFRGVVSTVEEEIDQAQTTNEPAESLEPVEPVGAVSSAGGDADLEPVLDSAETRPSGDDGDQPGTSADEDSSAWQPNVHIPTPESPRTATEGAAAQTAAVTQSAVIWDSPAVAEFGDREEEERAGEPAAIREAMEAAKAASGLDPLTVDPVYERADGEGIREAGRRFVFGSRDDDGDEGIRTEASDGKAGRDFTW